MMTTCLFPFHIVIQVAFSEVEYTVNENAGALTSVMVVKLNNVSTEQNISLNIIVNENEAGEETNYKM